MRTDEYACRSRAEFQTVDYVLTAEQTVKKRRAVTVAAAEALQHNGRKRLDGVVFAVVCICSRALFAVLDYTD